MSTSDPTASADVELRLPADGAYGSVVRTTATGLAARLDFTIDDIEDLRIAVGEATALVLPDARPGSDLRCLFSLGSGVLSLTVVVDTEGEVVPDLNSFAWQVLSTLAESADIHTEPGRLRVQLTMRSAVADLTG